MKEIRKEIREAILNEVGFSLARLGISGELFETKVLENKHDDTFRYKIESSPIQHTPMIFKKLIVSGSMYYIEVKEDDFLFNFSKKRDIIRVTLDYSYEHFGGGRNGCTLGSLTFGVEKDLPETFSDSFGERVEDYIRKIRGLEI